MVLSQGYLPQRTSAAVKTQQRSDASSRYVTRS